MALSQRAARARRARNRRRDRERPPEREAGDLLALEALDQTGLAVNSSGCFCAIWR